jgi:predicted  nucleic acid-binding Zn-ribbon protein
VNRNEETDAPKALLTREWPGEQRERGVPARKTTLRQIRERINQSRGMVADGVAEIEALSALQAEMASVQAPSVDALSPETRSRHREAIRLASGLSDGVEMW